MGSEWRLCTLEEEPDEWASAGKNPDQEYRGCTIHCYYFLHDAEEYATRPGEWSFAPESKELWQVMEQINKKIAREGSIPPWLKEHLE